MLGAPGPVWQETRVKFRFCYSLMYLKLSVVLALMYGVPIVILVTPTHCELTIDWIMQDFYSTVLTPWLSSSLLYSLYSGKSKISSSLWKSTGFQLSLDGIKIYIMMKKVYLIKLDTSTLGKIFREDSCSKMVPQGDSLAYCMDTTKHTWVLVMVKILPLKRYIKIKSVKFLQHLADSMYYT